MFIRSERLFLRPGWNEDWEELHALIADEQVVRNLASAPWPYRGEDARLFLDAPGEALLPRFLVTQPGSEGGRIVGCIGLGREGGEIELGYWIGRAFWGRGFASEAARAVIGLARMLGHERLVASHYVDNPASGRVLEKAGFRRTGVIAERYSRGRGMAYPAREYAIALDVPGGGDDTLAGPQSAETACRAAA